MVLLMAQLSRHLKGQVQVAWDSCHLSIVRADSPNAPLKIHGTFGFLWTSKYQLPTPIAIHPSVWLLNC